MLTLQWEFAQDKEQRNCERQDLVLASALSAAQETQPAPHVAATVSPHSHVLIWQVIQQNLHHQLTSLKKLLFETVMASL